MTPKSKRCVGVGIVLGLVIGIGLFLALVNPPFAESLNDSARRKQPFSQEKSCPERASSTNQRSHRPLNAEAQVRSLLRVVPGEVVMIRIPSAKLDLFMPEKWRENSGDQALVPISRKTATHGLEEILRQGGSLSSRVDGSGGSINWHVPGMSVKGEATFMETTGQHRIHLVTEGTGDQRISLETAMRVPPDSLVLPGSRIQTANAF